MVKTFSKSENPDARQGLTLQADFPDSSVGKEFACNAGDPSLIPESERSPGDGIGYPLQYSWVPLMAQLVKNPPAMWKTWGLKPGLRGSPGEGKGYPLQCLIWRIPRTV